ncbi:hypothetical protein ScalyP_jg6641, partial [Parmales sp. scaly parma]
MYTDDDDTQQLTDLELLELEAELNDEFLETDQSSPTNTLNDGNNRGSPEPNLFGADFDDLKRKLIRGVEASASAFDEETTSALANLEGFASFTASSSQLESSMRAIEENISEASNLLVEAAPQEPTRDRQQDKFKSTPPDTNTLSPSDIFSMSIQSAVRGCLEAVITQLELRAEREVASVRASNLRIIQAASEKREGAIRERARQEERRREEEATEAQRRRENIQEEERARKKLEKERITEKEREAEREMQQQLTAARLAKAKARERREEALKAEEKTWMGGRLASFVQARMRGGKGRKKAEEEKM